MIVYRDSFQDLTEERLEGFFHGWPNPPSSKQLLKILKHSTYVVLSLDEESGKVIGFVNALSDQVLTAYIPLLEVLPEYRGKGIGSELMRRMLKRLESYYTIDLLCDPDLEPFYSKAGMSKATGMMIRNYANQSGKL